MQPRGQQYWLTGNTAGLVGSFFQCVSSGSLMSAGRATPTMGGSPVRSVAASGGVAAASGLGGRQLATEVQS